LSLWLSRLSTDRLARTSPDAQGGKSPLVVFGKRGNADYLLAVDAAAQRLGLKPGLALAEARAMHPHLAAAPEDAAADAHLLEQIADWCERYTPLVAIDPPDGLLLDISGCAHLHGGEQRLLDDLVSRVKLLGFALHAAIAGTIGAAWAAARYGDKAAEATIVAPNEERAFLVALPVAALRLPEERVASLKRVGCQRVGDIVDLPRAPLAARFGSDLLLRLDRALGNEREPLNPRLPVAAYLSEQRFAEPIAREEDVLAITERLAARIATMLEHRGEGARQIELSLFRTDGAVRRLAVGTSRPIRDPSGVRALFAERLAALADAFDPGFGFDLARLSVLVSAALPPEQIGFDNTETKAEFDHLIDRLSARLGSHRVLRHVAQDSHIPELAVVTVPAQRAQTQGWEAFRHRDMTDFAPRPLRLLAKPEPIEAIATVPDGPPLRFRWRRALHEIIAAEGPERIEGAWWSEQGGPARDYFRVEDKSGHRFWVFRAGLYRDFAPGISAPRWFMHGTYA
jgi:protein ImuB